MKRIYYLLTLISSFIFLTGLLTSSTSVNKNFINQYITKSDYKISDAEANNNLIAVEQDANFYYAGRALQMFLLFHSDVDNILDKQKLNDLFNSDKNKIEVFKESFVAYTSVWSSNSFTSYRDFFTSAYLFWQNKTIAYKNVNYAWVDIWFTHFYPLLICENKESGSSIYSFDFSKISQLYEKDNIFNISPISYNWIKNSNDHGINLPGVYNEKDFYYNQNNNEAKSYLKESIINSYKVSSQSFDNKINWTNNDVKNIPSIDKLLNVLINLNVSKKELSIFNISLSWSFASKINETPIRYMFSSFRGLNNYLYNKTKNGHIHLKVKNFNPGANISLFYSISDFAYKKQKSKQYITNLENTIFDNFNTLFYLASKRGIAIEDYFYNFCLFSYKDSDLNQDSVLSTYSQWNEVKSNDTFSNQYINIAIDVDAFDKDQVNDYNSFKTSSFDRFNAIKIGISKILDGFVGVNSQFDDSNKTLYNSYKQILTPNDYFLKNLNCYIYGYSSDFYFLSNENSLYIFYGGLTASVCVGVIGAVFFWKRHIGM